MKRLAAEAARKAAEAERLAAEKAKAEADAARQAALQQQQLLAQASSRMRDRARLNAEQEKERLRKQLLQQFNMILETRDTARGLIVNMSDVLFDTASRHCGRSLVRNSLEWRHRTLASRA